MSLSGVSSLRAHEPKTATERPRWLLANRRTCSPCSRTRSNTFIDANYTKNAPAVTGSGNDVFFYGVPFHDVALALKAKLLDI